MMDESAFDVWTLVHIAVPLILGLVLARTLKDGQKWVFVGWIGVQVFLLVGVLILTWWEIVENLGWLEWIGCYGESTTNYIADMFIGTMALAIGIGVGSRGK